jgi:hypothetical protein
VIKVSLITTMCAVAWGFIVYMVQKACIYFRFCVCKFCVNRAQIPGDEILNSVTCFVSIIINFFFTKSYMYQLTCTKQKAPDNRFTAQSRNAGAQYRTCFISSV